MPFREEREANAQRIEALERDLAALRPRAEEAAALAGELAVLRREVQSLRAGLDPRQLHRVIWTFAGLGVLVLMVGAFVLFVGPSPADVARERGRAETAESALYACETEAQPLRDEHDAARRALADELRAHGQLVATAQITRRTGEAPVTSDDACVLLIDQPREARCTAAVACGGTWVFPREEQAGGVACERDDASAIARASGTGLDYDAAERSLAVRAEGWSLAMEVTSVLSNRDE